MKQKIITGVFFSVFLLLLVPTISAIEFNLATEQSLSKQLDTIRENISSMSQKEIKTQLQSYINQLKQITSDRYIDFQILIIVLLNILADLAFGKISILHSISIVLWLWVLFYEFVTGDVIEKCNKYQGFIVYSCFRLLAGLEYRIAQNKAVGAVISFIILIIGNVIYDILNSMAITTS